MEKDFRDKVKIRENTKYCKRCHRVLKDEKSMNCGYGKICLQKIQVYKTNYLFEMKEGDKNV